MSSERLTNIIEVADGQRVGFDVCGDFVTQRPWKTDGRKDNVRQIRAVLFADSHAVAALSGETDRNVAEFAPRNIAEPSGLAAQFSRRLNALNLNSRQRNCVERAKRNIVSSASRNRSGLISGRRDFATPLPDLIRLRNERVAAGRLRHTHVSSSGDRNVRKLRRR